MNLDHETQKQGISPSSTISDGAVYLINPLYRLRNSRRHYVLAFGAEGLPMEKLHRATAVTLALCDGKRTVAEVARLCRPLVKTEDDVEALKIAKERVKRIIDTTSHTQGKDDAKQKRLYGATSLLVTKAEYDREFSQFKPIEYHPCDFLPKDSSETHIGEAIDLRETAPVVINWHFTSECSTDCIYCYLGRRKIKPMPIKRTLSLIEEASSIGTGSIHLNGGDILLYPHLEDVLASLCKHKFLPNALATKSFLGKEKARMLAEARNVIAGLQFSIDSTISDVADYLVGARGFCNRVFASIENALEAGLQVDAKAVVTPYNILTIPKLYRDLKSRGVRTIRLAAYSRSGFHHSDDLFNHPASFQWLEEQIRLLQQEFPDDYVNIQNGAPSIGPDSQEAKHNRWPKRLTCSAGRSQMTICTDGKVIPCEQMPETEEYFCGDVSEQSIQEVWNGERLCELTYGMPRQKFKGQACYDCDELKKCVKIGNCIRDLAAFHGGIYQPPPNCPKHNESFVRMG